MGDRRRVREDATGCGRTVGEPHHRRRRGAPARAPSRGRRHATSSSRFVAGVDCRLAWFDAQLSLVEILVPALHAVLRLGSRWTSRYIVVAFLDPATVGWRRRINPREGAMEMRVGCGI